MPKSNAQKIAEHGETAIEPRFEAQLSPLNPSTDQAKQHIRNALDELAMATTLNVNIPSPDGDTDVDFVSDEQNGEVTVVKCRVANRLGKMQRGLLDNVIRQLDFSITSAMNELRDVKRQVGSAVANVQRSEDPTKLRDFIEAKCRWADVISDQVAFGQMLRDTAADAYFDLTGRPYVAFEKREKRQVTIAAPSAGATADPVMAAAAALLNG